MKFKHIIMALLAVGMAASCTETSKVDPDAYVAPLFLQSSDSKVVFDKEGGKAVVTVATNAAEWSYVAQSGDWFKISLDADSCIIVEAPVNNGSSLKTESVSDGKNGIDGNDGAPGEDGYSPVVTMSEVSGGTTITITDKTGTKTTTVKNGTDGTDGTNGAPGKDGSDGKSAYESAQDGGYTGTEEQFNTDLAGVGDKANSDDIPTQLSELADDTYHRLVTDTEKTTWDDKQSKIRTSGILKGDGNGGVSKAMKGYDYAEASHGVEATLTAADWSDGVQTKTIMISGFSPITASTNGSVRISQSATDEQFAAWCAAQPRVTAQAANTITIKASGAAPTIDIPVEVLIV